MQLEQLVLLGLQVLLDQQERLDQLELLEQQVPLGLPGLPGLQERPDQLELLEQQGQPVQMG